MAKRPLSTSIHRVLVVRVALAAIAIATVLAGVAYFAERGRVTREIVEIARLQAQRFNREVLPVLDAPGAIDRARMQAVLNRFSDMRGERNLESGAFVHARIYDMNWQEAARFSLEGLDHVALVVREMDQLERDPPRTGETTVVELELGGSPYVGIVLPLRDSRSQVTAHIAGAFAVSEAAVARMYGYVLRAVLYVIAIVFITLLIVYPIIAGLLGRMSGLTLDLLDANLETLHVLGGAIAKRDTDTHAHNDRVAVFAVRLAEEIGLSREQVRSLIKGALLHDVGKLGIRDDVLLKPGRLDHAEFEVMKTHVQHGLDITSGVSWFADARDIVGGHHERFDGTGYPSGVSGAEIPVNARIFAIVDVFDALTSQRPYKQPFSFEDTMRILEEGRGNHFDPELLDRFANVARPLYDEFSGQTDDRARRRLEALTQDYFRHDFADLLS